MKSALLRFAPVFDARIINDPKLARSQVVQRGALERIPRDKDRPLPLLVDHDETRVVGRVRELFIAPDVTGDGVVRDWWFASVDLDEPPPGWLKRNGAVSWAHKTLQEQDVNGTRRILRALVTEISILSPTVKPAEPFARVTWVGESAARTSPDRRAVPREQVIYGKPGQLIRRQNTGYVIAVR